MRTVDVIIEHAGKNLSAYIEGAPVITVGNTLKEVEQNIREAIQEGEQSGIYENFDAKKHLSTLKRTLRNG